MSSSTKKTFGSRKFYALPEEYAVKSVSKFKSVSRKEDVSKLIKYIEENVIGRNTTFAGPYGRRKVVYCDYTASARSLQFIEDYILKEVLPAYGNTHTTTTLTSLQSTLFRHEARDIIRNAVHASEDDAVIFVGSGATGAVHKLIHGLGFTGSNPPIVFAGPYEHHSNLLPWKEISAKIIRIQETKEGFLDLVDLENQLQLHRNLQPDVQLIGVFSASSNITGILADDVATTLLLHQYGALAFWDYATAAPYVPLDMNPFLPTVDEKSVYKDAMFFSGHKFVGGIQTPGVLIAKKSLFKNSVPHGCGGGSVFFVSRDSHRYLKDVEMREEGGTGAIVESVRLGLAMQLKMYVGVQNIMSREEKVTKQMLSFMRNIPELILLGSNTVSQKRLAVFSFVVKHPRGMFLHHNFVCAVLNDVFGIQARGGCACAGPYAQDLLGIDEELAAEYEAVLMEDSRLDRHHLRRHGEGSSYEMLRPGFTRISLPYFMSESEIVFIMEAIKMTATEAWKLLPQYVVNPETAEWRHSTNTIFRDRKWLGNIRYVDGKMTVNERKVSSSQNPCPHDYNDILHTARNIFNKARKIAVRHPLADQCSMFNERTDKLRWFMLPSEAQDLLLGQTPKVRQTVPFAPAEYCERTNTTPTPLLSPPLGGGCVSPDLISIASSQQFSRHNSLSALDIKIKNDKLNRNRSESPSFPLNNGSTTPRRAGVLSPVSPYYPRERCYSLGSNPDTPPPRLKNSPYFALSRQRQCSCGSQTDLNSLDSDRDGCDSPSNTSDNIQAYVEEMTKELATEIKSEIRDVINRVDDALSECSETSMDTVNGNGYPIEKRFSLESRLIKSNSLPRNNSVPMIIMNNYECYDSNKSIDSVGVNSFKGFETPPLQPSPLNESAMSEHVAEYLAELTTEMVTEMKSEFREMVNQVDEIICPAGTNGTGGSNNNSISDVQEKGEDRLLESIKEDSGVYTNETKDECTMTSQGQQSKPKACPLVRHTKGKFKESAPRRQATEAQSTNPSTGEVKPRWYCPPNNIWRPTLKAIKEFEMILDGDRVMVCLSGGKDSLSLLHTLHQYQYYARSKGVHFTLGAATVDPGSTAYDPRPLIPYLASLGVHYLYEEQPILEQAAATDPSSICSFCSRMKRGRLYAAARGANYNVLALGQHLDDLAETFLMAVFHNGRLRSMKAHYYIRERDLRVIRPFINVREKALRQFAENKKLPVIPENCPACFEAPKERHRTKQLLAQQEILFPKLFSSLRSAIQPLISFRYTGAESKVYNERLGFAVGGEEEECPPNLSVKSGEEGES
uniref:tRNA 2-thiocytidine biosynthesis protein TtcA n=1 Tax=Cacopsylla melanoneura TaxID=428564 RepID=A0A8D9FGV6_9HEMI